MTRRYSIATLALLAGFSAGGAALAQGEPVTLTWNMWASTENEVAAWQHLADMVHEVHPDIAVELQTTSWNDYWTRLPVLVASGQLPDIVGLQSLRTPNFYSVFEPLDPFIEEAGMDISEFETSIIEGLSHDGQVYALPYDLGPWVVYYNKDRFEEAGVPLPEMDWTREEFLEAARALTGDGQFGFGVAPLNWFPFGLAEGADYLTEERELDIANPAFAEAAAWYVGLVTEEGVSPPVPASADPGQITQGRFDSGNVAMYVDGPWQVINKQQSVNFEIGLAPIPAGSQGNRAVSAGSGFGIATTSENKEAAFRAVQVLSGPEALAYLAELGRALPARTAQQDLWFEVAAGDVHNAREAIEYSLEYAEGYRITANWNAVENLLNQYMPLAFSGSMPAEETLQTIQSLAEQSQ